MNDKLQDIKRKREMVAVGYDKAIKNVDIDWLIEQAEKAERYKKTISTIEKAYRGCGEDLDEALDDFFYNGRTGL
jgi:hypothetical protein